MAAPFVLLTRSIKWLVPYRVRHWVRQAWAKPAPPAPIPPPTFRDFDIAYVLISAAATENARNVFEHVARLRLRGHRAAVFCLDGDTHWFGRDVPSLSFADAQELQVVLHLFRGVKIATGAETAEWVARSLQASDRGYYFVQDAEESSATNLAQHERICSSYLLGLQVIAAGWLTHHLRERFGLEPIDVCFVAKADPFERNSFDRVIDQLEREYTRNDSPWVLGADAVEPRSEAAVAVIDGVRVGFSEIEYPRLDIQGPPRADWTIVIPTVNNCTKVLQCIRTCREQEPDASIEFVVVDDGSRDPAVRHSLREASRTMRFTLRENFQNLGFSAAVNQGLYQANGKVAILCNNDVLFTRPWVGPLRQAFENDPYCGIVGGLLLYPDGRHIQHAGTVKMPNQLAYLHKHQHAKADFPEAHETRYVWYTTGALMGIRRETLQAIGGLSVGYGLAYEDVDYCLTAWAMGIRVAYCGEFIAQHQEGGTRGALIEERKERPLIWLQREKNGTAYFQKKWAGLTHVENLAPFINLSLQRGPLASRVGVDVDSHRDAA